MLPNLPMIASAVAVLGAGAAAAVWGLRTRAARLLRQRFDQVTGLKNRRAFDDEAARLVDGTREVSGELCFLMFDIDGFGAVNARFGREFGDFLLRYFAAKAAGELRDGDTLFRLGGDEFCCLLPMTAKEDAAAIASRIRNAFSEKKLRPRKKENVRPTVSFGLASSRDAGFGIDRLRDAAEAALCDAKVEGCERTMLFHRGNRALAAA